MIALNDNKCHKCGQEGQATFEKKVWCLPCFREYGIELSRKSRKYAIIAIIFAIISILSAAYSILIRTI